MALDNNQLDKIVGLVKYIKDNKIAAGESFLAKLREVLNEGTIPSSSHSTLSKIDRNIEDIRKILCVQATPSIDYAFIPDQYILLRNQLMIDNLRMEQAALNIQEVDDAERFYNFCIHAFYQIENLINYYYLIRFPDFNDLVQYLKKNSNYSPNDKQTKIADIEIAFKLWVFCGEFFAHPDPTSKFPFDIHGNHIQKTLRQIRNQGLHRCHVLFENEIEAERESKLQLHKFYQSNTIEYVRGLVVRVVDIIKREIR